MSERTTMTFSCEEKICASIWNNNNNTFVVEAKRLRDTFFHFKVYVTNEEQSYLVSK